MPRHTHNAPVLLVLAVALAALALPSTASAYSAPGPRWPGTTVRYYQAMHPSWTWSVSRAARTWNATGARIRLVRVSSRSRAQVVVQLGRTGGHNAGEAPVGYRVGSRITIAGRIGQRLPPSQWLPMYQLVAHEFGHVLGLHHAEPTGCEIMRQYPISASPMCRMSGPSTLGLYQCGLPARDDVRGLLRLYGGRARSQRRWCPIQPAPPQLRDVRFTGGDAEGQPVRISWALAPRIPAGAVIEVGAWLEGRCGSTMRGDAIQVARLRATPTATSWTDTTARLPATTCYQVRIVNRWGYPARAFRDTRTSYAPRPAAPTVGALIEYPDDTADYEFDGAFPEQTEPRAAWGPSGACPAAPDAAGATSVDAWRMLDTGRYRLGTVPTGPGCISIFAVDPLGVASAPTSREIVHAHRAQ